VRIPWRTDAGPSECHFYVFAERPRCLVTRLLLQSPSPELTEAELASLVAGDCGGVWEECPIATSLAEVIANDLAERIAESGLPEEPEEPEVTPPAEGVEFTEEWRSLPEESKKTAEVEFVEVRPEVEGILCDAAIVATDEYLAGRSVSFSEVSEERIHDEVATFVRPISIGQAVATSGAGTGHPMLIHCVTHGLGSQPEAMSAAFAAVSLGLKLADDKGCRSVSLLDVFHGSSEEEETVLLREFAARILVEEWRSLELVVIYHSPESE